jgi:uncharacterized protein YaeQ
MALKATIYKAQLQIADMDRNVYADHTVVIARHPSEADERMMIRLLAFALNVTADDNKGKLEFAKDLWDVDEAALWHKDYTDAILHWIDVGLGGCHSAELCQQHTGLVESHRNQAHAGGQPGGLAN